MIFLSNDKIAIRNALNTIDGSAFIREIIRLYLEAYGVDYDFAQFFLQVSDSEEGVTAVVFRYNMFVYALTGKEFDFNEIMPFLGGFSGCSVIADRIFEDSFDNSKVCYIFSKYGNKKTLPENIRLVNDAKSISSLVAKDYDEEARMDFYLNTSHQLRHSLLRVAGYFCEDKMVSTASTSDLSGKYSVITFVYTDEYFRGNGASSKVLSFLCEDESKEYLLMCEEHNIGFYEKCGFDQVSTCLIVDL